MTSKEKVDKDYGKEIGVYVITPENKTLRVSVDKRMTIWEFKEIIETNMKKNASQLRILYDGRQLADHKTFCDYLVFEHSVFHVYYALRGD